MAEALYAGGVRLLEITFDQQDEDNLRHTPGMIFKVKEALGDGMAIGAGTVLTTRQAEAAVAAAMPPIPSTVPYYLSGWE